MKIFYLTAKPRIKSTKGSLNQLRSQGFVPAVIYGKNGNKDLYCFINDLKHLIYTGEVYKVHLKVGEVEYHTIIRDIQYDPMNDQPSHIDFMEVEESTVVKVSYPVRLTGAPVGVKEGGRLYKKIRALTLKGKIEDMPDHIEMDVTDLNIGNTLKVKDFSVPNIEIIESPATPIANVSRTRVIEPEVVEGAEVPAGEVKPEAAATPDKKAE